MRTADSALVILTKAPKPGQSNTRLVPPLSFEEAADLAAALLIDQVNHLGKYSAAQLFICYTPSGALSWIEALLPPGASCFDQQGESLGDRMRHAVAYLFARGFQRVILIGGDLPSLPLAIVDAAMESLTNENCEVVLGPSLDGGYYLVGMSRTITEIFDGMIWSRDDVLARTIEKLDDGKKNYKLLSSWYDIDTIADLRRLEADGGAAPAGPMEKTLALLRKLKQEGKLG
jgi:uncharacterized protein